jgi:hypothetical protein
MLFLLSFFLLFSPPFYPVDWMALCAFWSIGVSSALWKSRSDVGGAELFFFL